MGSGLVKNTFYWGETVAKGGCTHSFLLLGILYTWFFYSYQLTLCGKKNVHSYYFFATGIRSMVVYPLLPSLVTCVFRCKSYCKVEPLQGLTRNWNWVNMKKIHFLKKVIRMLYQNIVLQNNESYWIYKVAPTFFYGAFIWVCWIGKWKSCFHFCSERTFFFRIASKT